MKTDGQNELNKIKRMNKPLSADGEEKTIFEFLCLNYLIRLN